MREVPLEGEEASVHEIHIPRAAGAHAGYVRTPAEVIDTWVARLRVLD